MVVSDCRRLLGTWKGLCDAPPAALLGKTAPALLPSGDATALNASVSAGAPQAISGGAPCAEGKFLHACKLTNEQNKVRKDQLQAAMMQQQISATHTKHVLFVGAGVNVKQHAIPLLLYKEMVRQDVHSLLDAITATFASYL